MYKTRKEIIDALEEKDLNEYGKKAVGKSPEEIVEIFKEGNIDISIDAAKECFDYLKSVDVIEDEELDNVAGGTCYSSGAVDPRPGHDHTERPYVIVTIGNSCIAWEDTCTTCKHHFVGTPSWYCSIRWKGHEFWNPVERRFEDGECNW